MQERRARRGKLARRGRSEGWRIGEIDLIIERVTVSDSVAIRREFRLTTALGRLLRSSETCLRHLGTFGLWDSDRITDAQALAT